MIVNRNSLLDAGPITNMATVKNKTNGLSWGLSEAGYDIRIAQDVILHPLSRFKLASSIEYFNVPSNLVGIVHDKSTWARKGLSVFNTVIEPGWKGWLTLELVYHGPWVLKIKKDTGIAQVLFHATSDTAKYKGKYQDQPNRPVEAKNS